MTDAAASMKLSEEAKRAVEVLSEPMNSVSYIYGAVFCDLEELYGAVSGEKLAESVDFLLCDPPCNVRLLSELGNISHDVFGRNDMDDFSDMATRLIKHGRHKSVFCSAL